MSEEEIKRPQEATDLKQSADKVKGYESYYPKWINEYMEGGNTIFSDYELGGFRKTAQRYDEEYIPAMELFVDALQSTNSPMSGVLIKGISGVIKLMKDVVEYLDVIVGDNTENVVSQEDIGRLFQSMSTIEKQVGDYNKLAMQDKATKEVAKEVKDSTKVGLDDIGETSKLAGQRFKKSAPGKSLGKKIQDFSPKGTQLGKEMLSGVAGGLLGPLGGLGSIGVEAIGGVIQRRKQKKLSKERKKFASSVTGGVPFIEEEEFEMQQGLREGGRGMGGVIGGMPGAYSDSRGRMHDSSGKFISQDAQQGSARPGRHKAPRGSKGFENVGTAAVGGKDSGGMSLFTFFHKHAHRAKWTKEVLSTLKKIQKKAGKGGGGGGGLVQTAIGSALGVGAAGGTAAAAAGGLGLLGTSLAIGGGVVGTGLMAADAVRAGGVAEREGWLGPKGERISAGKGVAASVGGMFGGTGKGVGEEGATKGGLARNIGAGVAKGAGTGAMIGALGGPVGMAVGAAVGASIGGITHAIGGKRMAKAAKTVWDVSPLGMAVNAGSKLASGFKKKKIDKENAHIQDLYQQNVKLREKRKLEESMDIKKQEVKPAESKDSIKDFKEQFNPENIRAVIASDPDVQNVASSMKKVQDIGVKEIAPILREEVALKRLLANNQRQ